MRRLRVVRPVRRAVRGRRRVIDLRDDVELDADLLRRFSDYAVATGQPYPAGFAEDAVRCGMTPEMFAMRELDGIRRAADVLVDARRGRERVQVLDALDGAV